MRTMVVTVWQKSLRGCYARAAIRLDWVKTLMPSLAPGAHDHTVKQEMRHESRSIVVMKFGGTSVQDSTAIGRLIDIVKSRRDRKLSPVVVVSAMSGVTDQLLAAAGLAVDNKLESAATLSKKLRDRHLETAVELVGRKIVHMIRVLDDLFDQLDTVLAGIAAVGELTERTSDLVMGFGERLSSIIVAQAFEHRGLSSSHVDARNCIITDARFGKAVPLTDVIAARVEEHVLGLVQTGAIPVVGGFIGSTAKGIATTLGRGGSDYTAALIGRALEATSIEIWTDVNGIMTTDPRICPDALRLKAVSFEEASELAYFGAKVLHPATILPAVERNIPVWVLNSHNPRNEGTIITADTVSSSTALKSIAVKKHQTILHILSRRLLVSHGFLKAVFDAFDRHGCSVNMIATSEVSVSVAMDWAEPLDGIQAELARIADITVEQGKALVCLVGENIRGRSGIAARAFAAVKDINMQMISQGANGINMSFVIDEDLVQLAVPLLHDEFFRTPDPMVFDTTTLESAVTV
jgi:aspartate kinase